MSQSVQILYAVPVGAVIAWYQPQSTQLPPAFALCNGDVVTDAESPFYNTPTPNLIGRFILGANGPTTTFMTGGSVDFNVAGSGGTQYIVDTGPTQASNDDNTQNDIIQQNSPSTSYRYVLTDQDAKNDGNHCHAVSIPVPGWLALQFIMRIK